MNLAKPGAAILRALGVSAETARLVAPLGIVLALLLAAGATWGAFRLWDWWDDRAAIEEATAKANADFRARQVEAERAAGAGKEARDAANADGQRDLERKVRDADKDGDSGADAAWNGGLWADPED